MTTTPDLSKLRRHYLTEPGQALIVSDDPIGRMYAFSQFVDDTGLNAENVAMDTVCAVPLPMITEDMDQERPFAQVNPAMMWHPLFWLPRRLMERQAYEDDEGNSFIEDTRMWSLRVNLEMLSGLIYDAESGWLDMMELIGLDVTNPADLRRIKAWQVGGEDEALDSINLDELMRDDADPKWALETARGIIDDIDGAQWSVQASVLAEYLSAGVQSNDPEDVTQRLYEVSTLLDADFKEVVNEIFENLDSEQLADDMAALHASTEPIPFESLKSYAVPLIRILQDIAMEFADSVESVRRTFAVSATR
ncbi:hypothetical protein ACTXM3_09225 [Glutamicibacter arilaitensis]|uniref:hypothetical protein n=1 Tax=Glutamicibacter arilaitensis TaxID=256701 RepID=UPI003FD5C390